RRVRHRRDLIDGTLYDGVTAHPHAVRVAAAAGRLELSHDGGWSDSVDSGLLTRMDGSGLRLRRSDIPGWRLLLPDTAEPELAPLAGRVAPGATRGPTGIKVAALDVPMFNAAALPGGYIVVFKPAITETDPDALAGVLAHEIGHVRHRHVAEAMIRELGIGAVIRLFAGGIGANAEQIVSLRFTRANEAQADSDAIAS